MPAVNAAFDGDDEENQFLPNEEEVYQDLVKIQSTIARNNQVCLADFHSFFNLEMLIFFFLNLIN